MAIIEPLPPRKLQIPICPFARWCTENGIEPSNVTQVRVEKYGALLEEHCMRTRPREAYLSLIRAWNGAREFSPNCPSPCLIDDDRRDHYALPWSTFPPSLRDDIDAMITKSASGSGRRSKRRSKISPVTLRNRVVLLRAYTSAMVHSGWDASRIRSNTLYSCVLRSTRST